MGCSSERPGAQKASRGRTQPPPPVNFCRALTRGCVVACSISSPSIIKMSDLPRVDVSLAACSCAGVASGGIERPNPVGNLPQGRFLRGFCVPIRAIYRHNFGLKIARSSLRNALLRGGFVVTAPYGEQNCDIPQLRRLPGRSSSSFLLVTCKALLGFSFQKTPLELRTLTLPEPTG